MCNHSGVAWKDSSIIWSAIVVQQMMNNTQFFAFRKMWNRPKYRDNFISYQSTSMLCMSSLAKLKKVRFLAIQVIIFCLTIVACNVSVSAASQHMFMNNFFLPTSRKAVHFSNILLSWGCPEAPDGSSFCPLSSAGPARKRSVLGWGWGCFVYVHIPESGVWRLSKEEGLGLIFWAKSDPIWAKWDPSGQLVRKVANVIASSICVSPCHQLVRKRVVSLAGANWVS